MKKSPGKKGKAPATARDARAAGMLTRGEVAQRLGCGIHKVRSLEGTALHPERFGHVHVFDPAEVDAYAKRRSVPKTSGELAARAFEMFRDGKDFRDVVIELREHPDVIRELYEKYAAGGDVIVSARAAREIEAMGFGGEGYRLKGEDIPRFFKNLTDYIEKLRDELNELRLARTGTSRGPSGSPHPSS
ncbi:MAG TPA: hypothetical protein VJT73_22065 [Polyangiaceae bacterium]|nr:hypothetical protein [Polyangiaceae bacterium]